MRESKQRAHTRTHKLKWRKARKKPIIVEFREVEPKKLIRIKMPGRKEIWGEAIETREGLLFAYPDKDYIIKGIEGEIYPITKAIFHKTYDVIKDFHKIKPFAKKEMI